MKISQFEANNVNVLAHLIKYNSDIFLVTSKLMDLMLIDNHSYSQEVYTRVTKYCILLSNIVREIVTCVAESDNLIDSIQLRCIVEDTLDRYKKVIKQSDDYMLKKSFLFLCSFISNFTIDKTPVDIVMDLKYCLLNSLKLYVYCTRNVDTINNGSMIFHLNDTLLNYTTYEVLHDVLLYLIDQYNLTHITLKVNGSSPLCKDLLEVFVTGINRKRPHCVIVY